MGMMKTLRHVLLLLLLAAPGCIIGSWPEPEGDEQAAKPGQGGEAGDPLSPDGCDGRDNDADGAIDEGCPCSTDVRACIGVGAQGCGLGLQRCSGGVWQACGELGPPFTPARTARLDITAVQPQGLVVNGGERLRVEIEAVTRCAGIQVPALRVSLAASEPVMRVSGLALDGGGPPDAQAGDALFACELVSPFGPGVGAQELTLTASGVIEGRQVTDARAVHLEEAP